MRDPDPRFRPLDDLTPPDLWQEILTRRPRSATPLVPGRLLIAAVALSIAAGSGLLVLFTFSGREGSVSGGTPQVGPGTPSPSVAARFEPPIRREGDVTVMDVTFPDGTTAEISYASRLAIEDAGIQQFHGFSRGCASDITVIHGDRRSETRGSAPARVTSDADGRPAEIWRASEDWGDFFWIFVRRGAWTASIHADSVREAEACAAALGGRVDDGGWTVFSAEPPAALLSADQDQPGRPEVAFFSIGAHPDRYVLLFPGPCRPGPFDGDPIEVGGEPLGSVGRASGETFADWCADDLMRVHANAREDSWVRSVIRGLRIDRVTLAD